MDMDTHYRFMQKGEEAKVCSLVEQVFNEFVAPDYDIQGIDEFFRYANPLALAERAGSDQTVIVAEQGSYLVGVIELRNCDHIAMLFFSHRDRGIAKELIRRAVEECRKKKPEIKRITVNSSPYAEPFYFRMGFNPTAPLQKKNGIIFRPMAKDLE